MEGLSYWNRRTARLGRRRFVGGALLGTAGLAGAAACASSATTPAPAPTTAAVPAATSAPAAAAAAPTAAVPAVKYGGVAKFSVVGEAANQDPHDLTTILFFGQGFGNAYSRLVKATAGPERKDDNIRIAGDVADSWTTPDDVTYMFKLRPDVKFHNIAPVNGRALIADDVKYSFERQKALGKSASFLPAMDKIEVVDKQTLKITLASPDADFLQTLAGGWNVIVAKEAVDLKGDLKEGPTIGSSAFIADKWEPQSRAVLKKNPDYFVKGVPYLDSVEFLRISDAQTAISAFRSQQVALVPTSATRKDIDAIKKTNPELVATVIKRTGNGLTIGVDVTKAPFTDVRVRKALLMAIDQQSVADTVFDGDGWNTTTLQMPSFDWNIPDDEFKSKWFKRDVAGAKKLLADAGVAPGFELELVHLEFNPAWTTAAQLVIAQLKEIGINARIKPVDAAAWNEQQAGRGDYQGFHGPPQPQISANADLRIRLRSGGSRNTSRIKDAQLDAMIDKQATMGRDPEGRKKAFQDLQRYVLDQGYIIPTWGSQSPSATWPWLKNYRQLGQPSNEPEIYHYLWIDK